MGDKWRNKVGKGFTIRDVLLWGWVEWVGAAMGVGGYGSIALLALDTGKPWLYIVGGF